MLTHSKKQYFRCRVSLPVPGAVSHCLPNQENCICKSVPCGRIGCSHRQVGEETANPRWENCDLLNPSPSFNREQLDSQGAVHVLEVASNHHIVGQQIPQLNEAP